MDRWLERTGHDKGMIVPIDTVWQLAKVWYVDPRLESWRPRTPAESQAVLTSVGLTDAFWDL